MRLLYCRIYFNTVSGYTLSDLCSVLASRVNNSWARCFPNFIRVRTFQNSAKSWGPFFWRYEKTSKFQKSVIGLTLAVFFSRFCQLQFNRVKVRCINSTEKTTEKRLLTSSNRATIPALTKNNTYKLAAQKPFFTNLASRGMKTKLHFSSS